MNQSDIDRLARELAALRREVRALTASPRLSKSSVNVGDGLSLSIPQVALDSSSASLRLAKAIQSSLVAELLPDPTVVTVWFTDTTPAGADGDFWSHPNTWVLWERVAGVWAVREDQSLAAEFAVANEQATAADGFITTYWQTTAPVSGMFGDLWMRADAGWRPHRWDSAGWVPLVVSEAFSYEYDPGGAGWGFQDNGNAQVQDLAALGQLGAPQISTDAILVNGADFVEAVNLKPKGLVVSTFKGAPGGTGAGNIDSTELRTFELNAGTLFGGHVYALRLRFHFQRTVDASYLFRMKYATGGAEATVSSAVLPGGARNITFAGNEDVEMTFKVQVASTDIYRFAFCVSRSTASGTGAIYAGSVDRQFEWDLLDWGNYTGDDNDSLSQKLKQDGSGADNPPITTYTTTWDATDSDWFVDESGTRESSQYWNGTFVKDTAKMYQGSPDSSLPEGYEALAIFNYANIVSVLATAITITSCKLRITGRSRNSSAGLDCYICTHNFTSIPTTYAAGNTANIFRNASIKADVAPGSTYVVELGTTIGGQFKAGTRRGVGLVHPAHNTSLALTGSIHGAGAAVQSIHKPQLQITYTKAG